MGEKNSCLEPVRNNHMTFEIVFRATTVISKLLRMVMVNKVRFRNTTDAVAGLNNQRLAREQDLLRDEPMNLT